MSTTDATCRPTSARPRSSVGRRTAVHQYPQPSLGDVLEEGDETDILLSSDATKLQAAVGDDSPDVVRPQRRRRHRRPVPSRHKAAGKARANHHADNSNDVTLFAADTDDEAAHAFAADDHKKSPTPATETSQPASESPLEATSHEPGDTTFDKLPPKQPERHRQVRQKTTKKDDAHPKKNDEENKVNKVHATTSEKQSSTKGNRRASSALKHSKTRIPKRSGKAATLHHRSNTDYQLEMDNPEIKDWLRKKNRLLRKKRAEERRKERQERLVEERQKKAAEARRAESAKKVHAWMQEKLLKQRLDAESSSVTQAEKISAVIHQTFALESPDRPISVELTPKDLPAETTVDAPVHSKNEDHPTVTDVVSNQSRTKSARPAPTVPAVYSRSPRTAVTSTQNRRPPTKISLPQSDMTPSPSVDNVPCEAARLSFDDWLAMKRHQDVALRRQAQRVSSRFDEEESSIIRQVARRRIEAIMSGRRCVDSGLGNTDRGTLMEYPRVAVARTTSSSHGTTRRDQPTAGAQHHRAASGGNVAHLQDEGEDQAASISRNTFTTRRPMQSVNLADNLLRHTSTSENRPSTAFPARRSGSTNRTRRPTLRSATTPRTTGDVSPRDVQGARPSLITGDSFTVKKLEAYPTPKPILKPSKPYRVVKYQQRSWDKFSDHMWEDINKSEGEEVVPADRPEPVGSEKPQLVDDNAPMRPRDYLEPPWPLSSHDHGATDVNDRVSYTQHSKQTLDTTVADSREQDTGTTETENDSKKIVTFAEIPTEAEALDEANAFGRDIQYLQQQPASSRCPTGQSDKTEVGVQNVWNDRLFVGDDEEVHDENQEQSVGASHAVQFGVIPRIVINDNIDDETDNLVSSDATQQ